MFRDHHTEGCDAIKLHQTFRMNHSVLNMILVVQTYSSQNTTNTHLERTYALVSELIPCRYDGLGA